MDNAFDGIASEDAELIRSRLLAGDSMIDIRNRFVGANGRHTINAQKMRAMRDEVFEPLQADPEKVKDLANGPVLNPAEIVRYRSRPGPKPRMARPGASQMDMFPS